LACTSMDRPLSDINSIGEHTTGVRSRLPGNDIQKGRFTGAIRADDGNKLAVRDFQRHTAQRAHLERRPLIEGNSNLVDQDHSILFVRTVWTCDPEDK